MLAILHELNLVKIDGRGSGQNRWALTTMSVVMLAESAFFKYVVYKSAFEHAFELDRLASAACVIVIFSALLAGLINRNYEKKEKRG